MVFSHSSHPLPFSFPGNVGFAGCFVHFVFLLGLFLSESGSYRLLYPRFRSSVSAANRISRHLYGGSGIRSKQCGIHDAGVYASVLPGRMAACFFHRSVAASLSPSLAKRWAILYCFLPFLVFFSSIAYMSYLVDHQIPAPILLPLLLCLVLMKVLKLIFLIQTAVTLGRYLGGMKNGPEVP